MSTPVELNHAFLGAVMVGNLDKAKEFLECGADVQFEKDAKCALLLCAENGNLEMLKYLLGAGAKVNETRYGYPSALATAAKANHIDIVKFLVESGAELSNKNSSHTALMCAAENGFVELVKYLLDSGADTKDVSHRRNALMLAASQGHSDVVEILLAAGADINYCIDGKTGKTALNGKTALILAVEHGQSKVVDLLLKAGATVNAEDEERRTPLTIAVSKGNLEVVNLLLGAGSSLTHEEKPVLLVAVHLGNAAVVDALINAGADPTGGGKYDQIPLHRAAICGHIEVARRLLDAPGVDINVRYLESSALMDAIVKGKYEMAKFLIQRGANTNFQYRHEHYTVLKLVADRGDVDMALFLLKNLTFMTVISKDWINYLPTVEPLFIDEKYRKIKEAVCSLDFLTLSMLLFNSCDLWKQLLLVQEHDVPGIELLLQSLLVRYPQLATVNPNDLTPLYVKGVFIVFREGTRTLRGKIIGVNNDGGLKVESGFDITVDVIEPKKFPSGLELVVGKQRYNHAKILLEAGADPNTLTVEGQGVIHLLKTAPNLDLTLLLLSYGAYHSVIDEIPTTSPFFTLKDYHPVKDAICSADFLTLSVCEKNNYDIWFQLTQVSDVEGVVDIARSLVTRHPELALVKDAKGRSVTDLATPAVRFAINSMTLWFGKYRPAAGKPEHTSATCFVIKAMDESTGEGEPVPVALKLMRVKAQFLRETEMRKYGFDGDFVMTQSECYPTGPLTESDPDVVEVRSSAEVSGVLTKAQAEGLYCVVMPLADRNMFVAMKQERFAGKEDVSEVVTIFTQLVKCVMHVHGKGVLHGDIKPMNLVRMGGKWILIDLDACCGIGRDSVGFKSSSAYVPPECVFADVAAGVVGVKSESLCQEHGVAPLIAHESFDVWSLGCILYQFCSAGVLPLFAANQDDNLNTDEKDAENSLWALSSWSDALKEKKLSKVSNLKARNLLSLMLSRDPAKRPTLSRVLGHPFLSGDSSGGRMAGEAAEFDVFISYRVASDLKHATRLYEMLTGAGLRVWWDKKCLESGKEWQKGFCQGLGSSAAFLCILSRAGTEAPFESLQVESRCDNVLLEHRLALELKQIDYVKYVFPIMIGEENVTAAAADVSDGERYSLYRSSYSESRSHVAAVEETLAAHLDELGLGTPLMHRPSVYDVANDIRACNGYFIGGKPEHSFEKAVQGIVAALKQQQQQSATVDGTAAAVDGSQAASKVAVTLRTVVNESKPQGVMTMEEHESVRAQYEVQLEDLTRRINLKMLSRDAMKLDCDKWHAQYVSRK